MTIIEMNNPNIPAGVDAKVQFDDEVDGQDGGKERTDLIDQYVVLLGRSGCQPGYDDRIVEHHKAVDGYEADGDQTIPGVLQIETPFALVERKLR